MSDRDPPGTIRGYDIVQKVVCSVHGHGDAGCFACHERLSNAFSEAMRREEASDAILKNARERADAMENALKLFRMTGLGVTFVDEDNKVDLDTLHKMVEKFTAVINERNPKDWT